ncbi:MAG TPA: SAM-dependent chlorinase/fluorinase [Panacibacter sp.]|nr:SAM-dependent chlorinase/fluorinase [Panacibacter sp.]HNP43506.1 SAM-dependent chlorinase/fluorinase [Panacibacter sp.]
MPVLTLSTDIGLSDYLPGAIKGQFYHAVPSCSVADITHQLSPHNYQQAAYICKSAFRYYPAGTFHVVIINFFERSPRNILFSLYNNQYIICPDNGILTMITGTKPKNVFAVDAKAAAGSNLLDCTQLIAITIQKIINQESLTGIATPVIAFDEKYPMRAASGPDWIESQIIFIDNFENVVVNLTKEEFEEVRKDRNFKIVLMRNSEFITRISDHYASVQPGENLAFFNSAGYLEIAMNKGNVAGMFGLQRFNETTTQAMQHKLLYQTVRILFE